MTSTNDDPPLDRLVDVRRLVDYRIAVVNAATMWNT